jgi:hypothetical protein
MNVAFVKTGAGAMMKFTPKWKFVLASKRTQDPGGCAQNSSITVTG